MSRLLTLGAGGPPAAAFSSVPLSAGEYWASGLVDLAPNVGNYTLTTNFDDGSEFNTSTGETAAGVGTITGVAIFASAATIAHLSLTVTYEGTPTCQAYGWNGSAWVALTDTTGTNFSVHGASASESKLFDFEYTGTEYSAFRVVFATDVNGPQITDMRFLQGMWRIAGAGGSMWPENTTLSTSGQTQATSRIKCKAKGDLTKIKVLYANGSCHPSAAAGNQAVNIKSFVEHPAGVFTQLPIAGSTSPYALGTTEGKETDEVSIAIPHNADFWIRTHVSVSSGQWTVAFFSGGNGSGVEYGVDKSSSGTIANSVTACFAPCAIIGCGDVRPAFVMVGDSIMTGANDNRVGVAGTGDYKTDGADAEGPIGLAGRALLQDFPFMAWYKGGANSAHINSTALAKIISALGYCTHALSQMGVNNLSSTHAQIRTNHNNMYSLLKANLGGNKVVYQTTITPASVTSTNNYITTGGQTPGANESKRVLINPDIRGTYFGSNLDGYLEITDLYETARDSGIYKVPSTYDETNTATGGSTSTLTRTGAGWTVDIWVNYSVRIVAGTNNGSSARISTNSNQTLLSLSPAMPGANDATSVYEIWAVATRDGTHLNPGPNGYAVGAAAIRTWLEAQAV